MTFEPRHHYDRTGICTLCNRCSEPNCCDQTEFCDMREWREVFRIIEAAGSIRDER